MVLNYEVMNENPAQNQPFGANVPRTSAPNPTPAMPPTQPNAAFATVVEPDAPPAETAPAQPTTAPTELYSTMTKQVNNPSEPTFVGGVLMDNNPPAATPSSSQDTVGKEKPLKPAKKKNLPKSLIATVIVVIAVILVGGGFYYFYNLKQNEISGLNTQINTLNDQVATARRQAQQAAIEAEAAADVPLYADPNGVFSFYQKFSGLTVNQVGETAEGVYGTAADGFSFVARSVSLGGTDVSLVTDEKMQLASASGATSYDKRPEVIGTYTGFSYVDQIGDAQTITYLLVRDDQSTNYLEFSYTTNTQDDVAFMRNEEMVMRILSSVKLYQ